jgi:hypothetical protein
MYVASCPKAELRTLPTWWRLPRAAARPCPSALAERRSARAAQGVHAPDEVRGAASPRAGQLRLPVGQGRRPRKMG